MIAEHSKVALNRALPALRLEAGDIGVVVAVLGNGAAYEVEFMTLDGRTVGVETLEAGDIHAANASAIPHERERAAA